MPKTVSKPNRLLAAGLQRRPTKTWFDRMPPEIQQSLRELAQEMTDNRDAINLSATWRALVKWCDELEIKAPSLAHFDDILRRIV